jgi:hypothetical protein
MIISDAVWFEVVLVTVLSFVDLMKLLVLSLIRDVQNSLLMFKTLCCAAKNGANFAFIYLAVQVSNAEHARFVCVKARRDEMDVVE